MTDAEAGNVKLVRHHQSSENGLPAQFEELASLKQLIAKYEVANDSSTRDNIKLSMQSKLHSCFVEINYILGLVEQEEFDLYCVRRRNEQVQERLSINTLWIPVVDSSKSEVLVAISPTSNVLNLSNWAVMDEANTKIPATVKKKDESKLKASATEEITAVVHRALVILGAPKFRGWKWLPIIELEDPDPIFNEIVKLETSEFQAPSNSSGFWVHNSFKHNLGTFLFFITKSLNLFVEILN